MRESGRKNQLKKLSSHFFQKLRAQRNNRKEPKVEADHHEEAGPVILTIYQAPQKKEIAQVILNGYNIEQEQSFGSLGAMRSFKIVRGDLWEQWNAQTAVTLAHDSGQETLVKIAALPVDSDSFGLIEFVKSS
jgi:hypothetical protein